MNNLIQISILDDHQAIIDGYLYRLSGAEDIKVTGTFLFGEDLEADLQLHPVDMLILDVSVPTSPSNPNPFPI